MRDLDWTALAPALSGAAFERFQRELCRRNGARLEPSTPSGDWRKDVKDSAALAEAEIAYVESVREAIAPLVADIPSDADAFLAWYEKLAENGPGQNDPLFPWLERQASFDEMKWLLEQEVSGEAGFDDLVALTQIKMPHIPKLEMACNYWDEMGRGNAQGMHGPMLSRLAAYFGADARPERVCPESLALGNTMVALASNRHYAFHSIGALGAIEMTAPGRAIQVERGLRRLKVPGKQRQYFSLHAILDVKHSEAWNREVLRPLVKEDSCRAQAIGEGAVLRL
ncbi:iron-containing redox enzyme family protein [Methylocystis sp.]|uniref:iron-containing redox enzyme family protein n=1 Tax=Methylocystis sp. TaxID=1911079 RepID=UPI0025DD4D50|nr:iron-containing redox enzyme family protein [Methylocystis sp.]